jgi:hypothetical protein
MGKNYLRLELGGRERGLNFNMGCLKNIQEISNRDPFSLSVEGDVQHQMRELSIIVYSALLSNCKSKKEEPDFIEADVVNWVEELDFDEALNVLNAFRIAYQVESASTEGRADTRFSAAHGN